MDPLLLVMRLLHIVSGVFWAGTMIFMAFFLFPSVRDAGPAGGKVVAELTRRRFTEIVPVIAIVAILSGLWLYWRASVGFQPAYMGSRTGMTFGTGGAAAILSLLIGMVIVRPSMKRAAELAAAGPPDEARMAQIQQLRARAGKGGQIVALLLLLAVAAMAVGRYVGT
jgi:uncharacterized membrane protein